MQWLKTTTPKFFKSKEKHNAMNYKSFTNSIITCLLFVHKVHEEKNTQQRHYKIFRNFMLTNNNNLTTTKTIASIFEIIFKKIDTPIYLVINCPTSCNPQNNLKSSISHEIIMWMQYLHDKGFLFNVFLVLSYSQMKVSILHFFT